MKKLKVGDVVIAPEGCEDYLTAGKEYPVIEVIEESFRALDDDGDEMYSNLKGSAHLKGKDWIIKPKSLKTETKQTLRAGALILGAVAFRSFVFMCCLNWFVFDEISYAQALGLSIVLLFFKPLKRSELLDFEKIKSDSIFSLKSHAFILVVAYLVSIFI